MLTKLKYLQDLFDSEPNDATAVHNDEQLSSPLKEDYAPSLLAMNLKFDSAPLDDRSVVFSLFSHFAS